MKVKLISKWLIGILIIFGYANSLTSQTIPNNLTLLFTYPSLEKFFFEDLNGDRLKEIIGFKEQAGRGKLTAYDRQRKLWEYDLLATSGVVYFLMEDLDNDGNFEFIGRQGNPIVSNTDYAILVWSGADGTLISKSELYSGLSYPQIMPVLAEDLDGNGKKEILFKGLEGPNKPIGTAFYAYSYLNKDLKPIDLSILQQDKIEKGVSKFKTYWGRPDFWEFWERLPEEERYPSQRNFSFNKKQYTIKVEQRVVGGSGGKETPFLYVCTMNIYNSESNLVATYQPKLVYTQGASCFEGCTRAMVIDLNNDGNDEIIWLDDYWSEEPTFKVFSLKGE